MTRYQVDSEAVAAATVSIRATIGRLQAEAGGLHSQLLDLQSSWSGPAAAAFQTVAADWRATQQRVDDVLAAINAALVAAGQQYADTELANARLFGR